MQKVVIAAFVLLGCVCLIQAANLTESSTPSPPPGASNSTTQEPTSKPNTTESTEGTTAKTTIKATTSGVGTVKGFAGLVMSIFVIALM